MIAVSDIRERSRRCPARISPRRRRAACRRSELAAASIGTNLYGYAYDSIGNRLWSAENAATNTYSANSLNQYTSVAGNTNLVYDADGNMTGDGIFSYSYDAENRTIAAKRSVLPVARHRISTRRILRRRIPSRSPGSWREIFSVLVYI